MISVTPPPPVSIGYASQRASWPLDGHSLKLQPDTKAPVRKPLTINNASESSQIPHKRPDHQALIHFLGPLRQNPHSQRAYVFGNCPLGSGLALDPGDLLRDSQLNTFLQPSL